MNPAIETRPRNFLTILDSVEFDTPEMEIFENVFIRKPSSKEMELISESYRVHSAVFSGFRVPETEWIPNPQFPGSGTCQRLTKERWRYAVLDHQIQDNDTQAIQACLALCQKELHAGFNFTFLEMNGKYEKSVGFTYAYFIQYESDHSRRRTDPCKTSEIDFQFTKSLKNAYDLAVSSNREIVRILKSYLQLRALPRYSTAAVVLLFAIIESMVTHHPKLLERIDSITHQVWTKISFIRSFGEVNFRYPANYHNLDDKRTWQLLYEYRSCIAHGREPDWENKLKPLGSSNEAINFLREAARFLLVVELIRPDYMKKIREI